MKTIKEAIKGSGIPAKLIRAVHSTVGADYLEDLARHGANGGFPGITYYRDTVAFFKRNRKDIVRLVESMAEDMGEVPCDMVAGFNCLGGQNKERKHEYYPSIARCLYGGRINDADIADTDVANALCWFACEEVARAFNPDI